MFDSSLRSRQSADNQPQSVKPKLVTCFVLSARKLNGYVVFDLRSSNRICLQLSRCKQGFRSLSDRMTWQMRACCMQCVQHCSTAAVSPWLVICSAHLILLHHHRHSILVKIEHTKTNMLMTKWDGFLFGSACAQDQAAITLHIPVHMFTLSKVSVPVHSALYSNVFVM